MITTERKRREILKKIDELPFKEQTTDDILNNVLLSKALMDGEKTDTLHIYGCPSRWIECNELCLGKKNKKDKKLCQKCWITAMQEDVSENEIIRKSVDVVEIETPQPKSYFDCAMNDLNKSFTTEKAKPVKLVPTNENKNMSTKNMKNQITDKDDLEYHKKYHKLDRLNLTQYEILQVFEALEWSPNSNFDGLMALIEGITE